MSTFWERGYPYLPACGPRSGSIDGLERPIFSINNTRPSRGRHAKTSRRSGLLKLAPEERRFLCKPSPREVWMTWEVTTKARRAPAGAVQQFPLWCKEARAGVESRGISQRFPFPCNKTKTARTAGQRSSPSPPRRHDQRLCRRRPSFVRIGCTSCLPSNLAVVVSLPASVLGKRTKATINRA